MPREYWAVEGKLRPAEPAEAGGVCGAEHKVFDLCDSEQKANERAKGLRNRGYVVQVWRM